MSSTFWLSHFGFPFVVVPDDLQILAYLDSVSACWFSPFWSRCPWASEFSHSLAGTEAESAGLVEGLGLREAPLPQRPADGRLLRRGHATDAGAAEGWGEKVGRVVF